MALTPDGTKLIVSSGYVNSASPSYIYIFTRNGSVWTEEAKFKSSYSTATNTYFADSIDIDDAGTVIAAIMLGSTIPSTYLFT